MYQNRLWIFTGVSLVFLIYLGACQKEGVKPKSLPVVLTGTVSGITSTSAVVDGQLISEGNPAATERGICYGTDKNPTIADMKSAQGSGLGSFSASLTSLKQGTTYHARAYATNTTGTSYGLDVEFSSAATIPTVNTSAATSISLNSVTIGGTVTSDGGASVTARGVCWSTNPAPTLQDNKTTDGQGVGVFTSQISNLNQGTTYYVRSYATNAQGTAYGQEVQFKTLVLPVVSATDAVTFMKNNRLKLTFYALSGGETSTPGDQAITERGLCWGTQPNPTIQNFKKVAGGTTGKFTLNIENLSENTRYYVRAYATNSAGTAYGPEVTTETPNHLNELVTYGSLTDIDGNTYPTVQIGTQTWMAENLRTTRYANGQSIQKIDETNVSSWEFLTTGAYIFNDKPWGNYYNWFTVSDSRKICPSGWHVPSKQEWLTLVLYLQNNNFNSNGINDPDTDPQTNNKTGQSIKSEWGWDDDQFALGTTVQNPVIINKSGFSAIPAGSMGNVGNFCCWGNWCSWWTSDSGELYHMTIGEDGPSLSNYYNQGGLSIRCVKD